jgi:uncharacterized integral membrane protein (TIGR00697 family)
VNELIFFGHIFIVLSFIIGATYLGRGALISFIALQAVLANLLVVKQMSLFGFIVTCSDVFAVGGILSLNVLQEYFGRESAKEAAKVSFLALIFYAFMSQIHIQYLPSSSDATHGAFVSIFSTSTRLICASIATFYLVQQFDYRFFSLLKGNFPFRVVISLCVSQLIDTILFSILGLYGMVESLFDIIILSFTIKCLVIAVSSPFTLCVKRFVRREISV